MDGELTSGVYGDGRRADHGIDGGRLQVVAPDREALDVRSETHARAQTYLQAQIAFSVMKYD